MEHIEFSIQDKGLAIITLKRPQVLNSFNRQMALELQNALAEVEKNNQIRAILLTGEGRAFCAGQDLAEAMPKEDGTKLDLGHIVKDQYNPVIAAIRRIEKPFVAAVNGTAAGAGANLALACDFVLAAENASFIQAFVKIGLIPDSGGTFLLPRLVGMARASALTMLGQKLSAEQALSWGLIYQVCKQEELLNSATALAHQLASLPTKAIGLTKRAINATFNNTLEDQLALEEQLQREAGYTHDHQEGVKAFLEKRNPSFKGE